MQWCIVCGPMFDERHTENCPCSSESEDLKDDCDLDHCTLEERAIIKAAIDRRKSALQAHEEYWEYDADLNRAVDALLAARSKSEVKG